MTESLAIVNIGQLVTLAGPARPRAGAELRDLGLISDAALARGLACEFVACVGVAHDAEAGVVVEHALDLPLSQVGAVGDRDLPGVERVTHAHAAAVVEADPRRSRCSVEQRIQDRPIRNRVRSIEHLFRLAIGAGHRAGIEMVAAYGDGR